HTPIAVPVRHIHSIGGWIYCDVGRQIEQGCAVTAAVLVIAVWSLCPWAADHHHKLAVLGELQDHAVGAVVRRPGGAVWIAIGAVAAEINKAVVVDEDAVFAGRPHAPFRHLAL